MTTPDDTPEPSPASAGSHGLPVAWAVMQPDSCSVFASRALAEKMRELCAGGDIVPLYRSPTLTYEERNAIWLAANRAEAASMAVDGATLRGLLERLGGAR